MTRPLRLLVTRPAEDAAPLVAALQGLGADAAAEPLLDIVVHAGPPLDLKGTQALLVTSANGARAFAARNRERDIPILAVGDASARQARALGFANVASASGDVAALAALCRDRLDPKKGDLLHVAGSHVAGDLARLLQGAGFHCRREVLYESRASAALSAATIAALRAGTLDGVLFFSPRTAEAFVVLAARAGVAAALGRLTAFCLSPPVADKARAASWGKIAVARSPDQDSLLRVIAAEQGAQRGS